MNRLGFSYKSHLRKHNDDKYYMNNYSYREGGVHPNNSNEVGTDLSMTGTSVDGSLHIPIGDVYPDDLSSMGIDSMNHGKQNGNSSTLSSNGTALPTSSPTVILNTDQPTFNPDDSSTINGTTRKNGANESHDAMLEGGFESDGGARQKHLDGNKQLKETKSDFGKDSYYLPSWIAETSKGIRVIMVMSFVLLVGSVLLVVVAVVISTKADANAPSSSNFLSANNGSDNNDTNTPRTPIVIVANNPTASPTTPPVLTSPDVDITSTTFYVVGGKNTLDPDTFNDVFQKFPNKDGDWLVHMGDLFSQDPSSKNYQCNLNSYQDVSTTYKTSSLPILFVPGEIDYNNCPVPQLSWNHWIDYLSDYTANGIVKPGILRQVNHPENFAMKQGQVIFLGLNMIKEMHAQNLNWITTNVESNQDEVEIVVLFGSTAYTKDLNSGDFFDPLLQHITDWNSTQKNLVFLYVTKSDNKWEIKKKYLGNDKLFLLNIQSGIWPPMQIKINTFKDTMTFDQDEWYKKLKA